MYSIDQLSTITGLTTRTLRNYLKLDILHGSKENGIWQFSEEQVYDFIMHPSVRPSIRAKHHAIVYDFMSGYDNTPNEACVLLDLAVEETKAKNISEFFCEAANHSNHIRFAFSYHDQMAHIILKGAEAEIREIMREYYLSGV